MKMISLSALLAALLLAGPTLAASEADYQAALQSAKSALSSAAKAKWEWRDSEKSLKAAEKAASEGDFAKAVALAKQVEMESKIAVDQSIAQANAGNPSYLY